MRESPQSSVMCHDRVVGRGLGWRSDLPRAPCVPVPHQHHCGSTQAHFPASTLLLMLYFLGIHSSFNKQLEHLLCTRPWGFKDTLGAHQVLPQVKNTLHSCPLQLLKSVGLVKWRHIPQDIPYSLTPSSSILTANSPLTPSMPPPHRIFHLDNSLTSAPSPLPRP